MFEIALFSAGFCIRNHFVGYNIRSFFVFFKKINRILLEIRDNPQKETAVELTFFRPDGRKDGGAIITVPCTVRRIDEIGRSLILSDRSEIEFENILSIKALK